MPGLRAFWFYEKTVVRQLVRQFRYKKTGSTAGDFLICTAGFLYSYALFTLPESYPTTHTP